MRNYNNLRFDPKMVTTETTANYKWRKVIFGMKHLTLHSTARDSLCDFMTCDWIFFFILLKTVTKSLVVHVKTRSGVAYQIMRRMFLTSRLEMGKLINGVIVFPCNLIKRG